MVAKMRIIHFFVSLRVIQVNCQFLSILQELDMKNPVIVGDIKELKVDKMFHLMKTVMEQNKSGVLVSMPG